MPMVTLQSNDGQTFVTEPAVARCSGTIRNMLDACGTEDAIVPLPNVHGDVLKVVLQWARHHVDEPPPSRHWHNDEGFGQLHENEASVSEADRIAWCSHNIGRWDQELMGRLNWDMLYDVMRAARYLDVAGLLETSTKTVANMIRGKSANELRALFGMKVKPVKIWVKKNKNVE